MSGWFVTPKELYEHGRKLEEKNDAQHAVMEEKVEQLLIGQARTNALLEEGKRTMENLGRNDVDQAERITALEKRVGGMGRYRKWINAQMEKPFVAPVIVFFALALLVWVGGTVRSTYKKANALCETRIETLDKAFEHGTYTRKFYVLQRRKLENGDCS